LFNGETGSLRRKEIVQRSFFNLAINLIVISPPHTGSSSIGQSTATEGRARGGTVVYAVRVTLELQEWERALEKAAGWVPRSAEDLPPAIQADVLRRVMKQALQRHHEWLARHEIAAVITAVEENERTYVFYFESVAAASRFREEFGGDLTHSAT
jgi:hypothetical protein